jgi:hypothetical protein
VDLAKQDLAAAGVERTPRSAVIRGLARGHILVQDGDAVGAIEAIDGVDVLSKEIEKFVNIRTEAMIEIAAVSFLAGITQRAIDAAAEAARLARAKGNRALLSRAERDLERYGG